MYSIFVLFFLANESWHDVELTLAQKGKLLYKYILVNYGETDFSQRRKNGKMKNGYGGRNLDEKEMDLVSNFRSNQMTSNNLEANLISNEEHKIDYVGDDRRKRRVKELLFQIMCMFVGVYYAMIFTSWTSIYGHTFTAVDIVDYSTIWVRFGSTVIGLVYIIVMSIRNILQSKRYS